MKITAHEADMTLFYVDEEAWGSKIQVTDNGTGKSLILSCTPEQAAATFALFIGGDDMPVELYEKAEEVFKDVEPIFRPYP
jgi:hypothetical protein